MSENALRQATHSRPEVNYPSWGPKLHLKFILNIFEAKLNTFWTVQPAHVVTSWRDGGEWRRKIQVAGFLPEENMFPIWYIFRILQIYTSDLGVISKRDLDLSETSRLIKRYLYSNGLQAYPRCDKKDKKLRSFGHWRKAVASLLNCCNSVQGFQALKQSNFPQNKSNFITHISINKYQPVYETDTWAMLLPNEWN